MADELNDAVIARLMAGDDPQDYDDGGEDSDDPDYGMELKKKAKKGAKRGRPRKAATAPAPAPPAQQRQPAAPLQQHFAAQQFAHPSAMVALAQQQAVGGAAAPHVQLPPGAFALPPGISIQQAALMGAFPNLLPMAVPMAAVAAPTGPAAQPPAAASAAQPLPPPQQAQQQVKQDMEQLVNDAGEEITATGRRKRKDTGKQRQHSRSWGEDEEQRFLEALELYGREWKKCAEHVGTRDHRAFTSHAQKHFIKLLLRGEEVPNKVAESGRGYTLSGKPLDPNSASAAAYGLKPDLFAEVCKSGRLQVGVHVTTFEMSEEAAAARKASSKAGKGASPAASGAGPSTKRQRRGKSRLADDEDEEETDEDAEAMASLAATAAVPGQRTEYARNRPRREAVGQRAKLGDTTESLELTHLNDFVGPPGTGAPLAQPFVVQVESQALLVADFHAHLSRCEIIGLLGGTFDPEKRVMEIKEAFPCRRAAGSDSSTSVELDAESQVEATAAMEERGLVPVGWYHSHPIFEPRPSAKDNENQRNYQAMFRDPSTGLEPWVGLIVGPYDQSLETPASRTQLWVVRMKDGQLTPYGIRSGLSVGMPGKDVQQKIEEALEQLQEDVGRVDLSEPWRAYTHLVGGQPSGGPMTKIQKLRASLLQHLPRDQPQAAASFLEGVTSSIETAWDISLAAATPAAAAPAAVAAAAAVPAAAGPMPPPGGGLPQGMVLPKVNAPGIPAGMVLPIVSSPTAGLPPMALPGMGGQPGGGRG